MVLALVKVILVVTLGRQAVLASPKTKTYAPADNGIRVLVIPVGKKGFEDQESRIEVRSSNGRLLRWKSFVSADGEHGRGVDHGAWTRDAQFFVFNAPSSGGHMPWNLATYFYSRRENRFYRLDNFIGPVTSDFALAGRNSVKTTRFNFDRKEERERVTVRLESLTKKRREMARR